MTPGRSCLLYALALPEQLHFVPDDGVRAEPGEPRQRTAQGTEITEPRPRLPGQGVLEGRADVYRGV